MMDGSLSSLVKHPLVALILDLDTLKVVASKTPFLMLRLTPLNHLLGGIKDLRCQRRSGEVICAV
jgi:hypothetical protein